MLSEYPQNSESPRNSQPPIASEQFTVDRKKFYLDLKENSRGRVYKITEDVSGHRDTIMLPAECVSEFIEALSRLASIEQALPPL
jgi:hypothetical protein